MQMIANYMKGLISF